MAEPIQDNTLGQNTHCEGDIILTGVAPGGFPSPSAPFLLANTLGAQQVSILADEDMTYDAGAAEFVLRIYTSDAPAGTYKSFDITYTEVFNVAKGEMMVSFVAPRDFTNVWCKVQVGTFGAFPTTLTAVLVGN